MQSISRYADHAQSLKSRTDKNLSDSSAIKAGQAHDTIPGIKKDTIRLPFIEEKTVISKDHDISFISRNISRDHTGDWYLMIVIGVLILTAWIRIAYSKFFNSLFTSSVNYQAASKVYAERGITQKRIGYVFDLIYMLNGALLLFQMYRYFDWHFLNLKNPGIFAVFLGLLGSLMLLRVLTMMMIGYVFDRSELFRSFLFHFYIYSKVTGILLIPFIISIPYTREPLTEFLIYGSLLVVGVVSLLRILRVLVFISKNVLLYFYLILYLCTVEILPIAVIIKLMISLT